MPPALPSPASARRRFIYIGCNTHCHACCRLYSRSRRRLAWTSFLEVDASSMEGGVLRPMERQNTTPADNASVKRKQWQNVLRIILSIPFLAVGFFTLAWSLVCFAGAPDGQIGSSDSLLSVVFFCLPPSCVRLYFSC